MVIVTDPSAMRQAAKRLESAREQLALQAIRQLDKLLKSAGAPGSRDDTHYNRVSERLVDALIEGGWV